MKKLNLTVTLIFLLIGASAFSQKKAVFIILDGIPADVIEKIETPALDAIRSKGGYTRAYQGGERGGYSESPTVSAVGYNHVLTGTWSNKHNVWDNDIKHPNYNYWNVFRIAKTVRPQIKTAIFSSWTDNRTKLIGENLPAAGNFSFDYSYDGLELDKNKFPHNDSLYMFKIDEAVSTEASRYIREQGPDLSWIYLEFTDDMGHAFGDGPRFYDAVKKADGQVARIWEAIQARQQQFKEEWMIVVTTDHGRSEKNGKGHGGQTDRERTAWIATNANPLNAHFTDNPASVDIAPSILRFMNINAPVETLQEFDGTPFIGPVSVSNLKAVKTGHRGTLTWVALNGKGQAEIKISTSNNFKTGQQDTYTVIGSTAVSAQRYTFELPYSNDGFYKIILKAPDNTLNTWISNK